MSRPQTPSAHPGTADEQAGSPRHRARATRAGLGAVGLALALSACGGASSADDTPTTTQEASLVVSDAWVRATTGSEDPTMTGAFMNIDNDGEADVSLTGASSPGAGMVELHTMAMADGAMVMRRILGGIEIEAGYGQALMPGGDHVMLMGLTEELAPGEEVELVLEFSDGSSQELTVPVKAFTEEEGHYHEPGTPADHGHGGSAGATDPSPSGAVTP